MVFISHKEGTDICTLREPFLFLHLYMSGVCLCLKHTGADLPVQFPLETNQIFAIILKPTTDWLLLVTALCSLAPKLVNWLVYIKSLGISIAIY